MRYSTARSWSTRSSASDAASARFTGGPAFSPLAPLNLAFLLLVVPLSQGNLVGVKPRRIKGRRYLSEPSMTGQDGRHATATRSPAVRYHTSQASPKGADTSSLTAGVRTLNRHGMPGRFAGREARQEGIFGDAMRSAPIGDDTPWPISFEPGRTGCGRSATEK